MRKNQKLAIKLYVRYVREKKDTRSIYDTISLKYYGKQRKGMLQETKQRSKGAWPVASVAYGYCGVSKDHGQLALTGPIAGQFHVSPRSTPWATDLRFTQLTPNNFLTQLEVLLNVLPNGSVKSIQAGYGLLQPERLKISELGKIGDMSGTKIRVKMGPPANPGSNLGKSDHLRAHTFGWVAGGPPKTLWNLTGMVLTHSQS
ncbi:hypothetical protein F5050DRAFT_1715292 [Lentinula boryana]|uniref:Uncharacterized protein n=1 Tax=Lentinula boryana TaxID=40481 RepID=A0ABQ8Q184_9AGAR|nr:hypothetical protein F5050DRAFT_1715292 [Lentinula boryana]